MKYIYKILVTDTPEASEEQLNGFGKEGWMLSNILFWNGKYYYYFIKVVTN